jgi:hypothetical protein
MLSLLSVFLETEQSWFFFPQNSGRMMGIQRVASGHRKGIAEEELHEAQAHLI